MKSFFIIPSYRCDQKCDFCLFRYNSHKIGNSKISEKAIRYVCENANDKLFVKITGGEPFLCINLLEKILKICDEYPEKIEKIGIGTNGTIIFPDYLNSINIPTYIYISRHAYIRKTFDNELALSELNSCIINKNIKYAYNCNLIRGHVDSVNEIFNYIQKYRNVYQICFRQLNKINISKQSIYPREIFNYAKCYESDLIRICEIMEHVDKIGLQYLKTESNHYEHNYYYIYGNDSHNPQTIKFRVIDELELIEYNDSFDGIDEYVLHPDGRLTGCWDYERKIIKYKEFAMPSRPYICRPKKKWFQKLISIFKK